MVLTKLARISALSLILFLTAITAFAQGAPPCGCDFCTRKGPDQSCSLDGAVTTCGYFLSVALCPPVNTATSADSMSTADEGAFLAAISGTAQEPVGCATPSN